MRVRWPGRTRLPDDVRRAAELTPGERLLASAVTVDGDTVVATTQRLLLVAPEEQRWARPWSRVDAAVWDGENDVLRIEWLGEPTDALALVAGAGPRLPETVRERVESSVVMSRRAEVPGGAGARLVVRRAGDGLVLQVVPDPGARLDDPALAAAVEEGRRELAGEVGPLHAPGELGL